MFLVLPKGHNQSKPAESDFNAEAPARVKKACDRCRMKKSKCNGQVPCGRCIHDKVQCRHTTRPIHDMKALSREYIASLEAQQAQLVDALRKLCAPELDDPVVKSTLDRLKMHGLDVDLMQENIRAPDQKTMSTHLATNIPLHQEDESLSQYQDVPTSVQEQRHDDIDIFQDIATEPFTSAPMLSIYGLQNLQAAASQPYDLLSDFDVGTLPLSSHDWQFGNQNFESNMTDHQDLFSRFTNMASGSAIIGNDMTLDNQMTVENHAFAPEDSLWDL